MNIPPNKEGKGEDIEEQNLDEDPDKTIEYHITLDDNNNNNATTFLDENTGFTYFSVQDDEGQIPEFRRNIDNSSIKLPLKKRPFPEPHKDDDEESMRKKLALSPIDIESSVAGSPVKIKHAYIPLNKGAIKDYIEKQKKDFTYFQHEQLKYLHYKKMEALEKESRRAKEAERKASNSTKKPRGRPPKNKDHDESRTKRPRGRPPKKDKDDKSDSDDDGSKDASAEFQPYPTTKTNVLKLRGSKTS